MSDFIKKVTKTLQQKDDNCNKLFDNCFVLYMYILADNFDFTQSLKTEALKINFFCSFLENYEFDY